MQNVKDFVTKNILWKLIALVTAFVVWFIAMGMADPILEDQFNTSLQILGLSGLNEHNLVIMNQSSIEGTLSSVSVFTRGEHVPREYVMAYVDLSEIDLASITSHRIIPLPVAAEVREVAGFDANYILTSHRQPVNIEFDVIERRPIPITIQYSGELAPNFEVIGENLLPAEITVVGAVSHLDQIHQMVLEVDLEGMETEDNPSRRSVVRAIDGQGNDITALFNAIGGWSVNAQITLGQTRWINVHPPEVVGTNALPASFHYVELAGLPASIQIAGPKDVVQNFHSLSLSPELDITGLTEDTPFTFDLVELLPEGVVAIDHSILTATVVIQQIIEEPIHQVTLPLEQMEVIDLQPNMTIQTEIPVTLRGNFDFSSITGQIQLTDLPVGVHQVPVTLNLPVGAIMEQPYVIVTVEEALSTDGGEVNEVSVQEVIALIEPEGPEEGEDDDE